MLFWWRQKIKPIAYVVKVSHVGRIKGFRDPNINQPNDGTWGLLEVHGSGVLF